MWPLGQINCQQPLLLWGFLEGLERQRGCERGRREFWKGLRGGGKRMDLVTGAGVLHTRAQQPAEAVKHFSLPERPPAPSPDAEHPKGFTLDRNRTFDPPRPAVQHPGHPSSERQQGLMAEHGPRGPTFCARILALLSPARRA